MAGAKVTDVDLPPDFARAEEEHKLLSSYEFALNLPMRSSITGIN
jgi:hypothetical protein